MNEEIDGVWAYWLGGLLTVVVVVLVIAYPRMEGYVEKGLVVFSVFLYVLRQYLVYDRLRREGDLPKTIWGVLWLLGPGTWYGTYSA